jgi:preprotein translocase subunit SecB
VSLNSILRLERSFYDRVLVEAVPAYETQTSMSLGGTISVEIMEPDKGRPWVVVLRVTVAPVEGEPTPPYTADLRAIGHFRLTQDEGGDLPDDAKRIVAVNGGSLLYSGMRELFATLTARGPWPQVLLPTVDFRTVEVVSPAQPAADDAEGADDGGEAPELATGM